LAAAFARLGSERDGGRWFTQPMRADLLRPAVSYAREPLRTTV
jgi:hypothetical protein